MQPFTSAWQQLEECRLKEDPDLLVPAVEVLAVVQRTLCLLGNASELISQTRHTKILEAVDPSWSRYGTDEFPYASSTLFGEEFQETLSKKVVKNTALSKAVSITKRAKKDDHPSSTRRGEQKKPQFFRGSPPARYGGRQGTSFFPYNSTPASRQGECNLPRQQNFSLQQRQGQAPLFHEPRLPGKAPQKKF